MPTTEHMGWPLPDEAATVKEEIVRLRDQTLPAIDGDVHAVVEGLAGKAEADHDHEIGDVSGLATALADKMPADATFSVDDLTDVVGADAAPDGYVLVKVGGQWVAQAALAAIGDHDHTMGQVTGLTAAFTEVTDDIAALGVATEAATTVLGNSLTSLTTTVSTNRVVSAMARFGNMFVNHNIRDSQEKVGAVCTANGDFIADQWAQIFSLPGGAVSAQQVTQRTKSGNDKQIEVKCLNTVALTSTQFYVLTQPIEASRLEYKAANWGTADAKPMVFRTERMFPAGLYNLKCSNYNETRNVTVPFTVVAGGVAGVIGDALGAVPPIVIPADTGGTWLRGDGQIGCTIDIVLAAGSSRVGGTAGVWGATPYLAATAQKNFFDSTANVGRVADLGIKPDFDGAGVYGQYGVGETDAVYRSERYFYQYFGGSAGFAAGSTSIITSFLFPVAMAKGPSPIATSAVALADTNSFSSRAQSSPAITDRFTNAFGSTILFNNFNSFVSGEGAVIRMQNSAQVHFRARLS